MCYPVNPPPLTQTILPHLKEGNMPNLSVEMRDTALTKRNQELHYLRRLVGQLKSRIAELEGNRIKRAVDVCPVCFGDQYMLYNDGLMHPCPSCKGTGKRN
jgi:hypothetical protein